MATVEDAVFSKLSSTSAITSVVGARIYRLKMPDNPQLPCITFETSAGTEIEDSEGYAGLAAPIITFHFWATTPKVAQELAVAARDALVGEEWSYGDRHVRNVLEWSTVDLFDPETEIFHVSASVRIWYQ